MVYFVMKDSLILEALVPCEQLWPKVAMYPMNDSCLYVQQVAGFWKCSIKAMCAT